MPAPSNRVWTAAEVEERLIEAILVFARFPNKERGWQHTRSHMPQHLYDPLDHGKFETGKAKIGIAIDEMDRVNPTLDWLKVPTVVQRMVMQHVLIYKSLAYDRIPWEKIKRRHGWGMVDVRSLKKQYGRGLQSIADALTTGHLTG